MALNVYNQTFNTGIDRSVLKEVSQEILKRAAAKNSQYNTSSSSFSTVLKTQNIGIDLYSGRVDTQTQRQISLNNSGLNIQLNQEVLNSIKYLNTQAAQNVQKNVEGKLIAPVAEGEKSEIKNIFNLPGTIELTNSKTLDKDKRGSNPFSFYAMNANKGKEAQEEKAINIFA